MTNPFIHEKKIRLFFECLGKLENEFQFKGFLVTVVIKHFSQGLSMLSKDITTNMRRQNTKAEETKVSKVAKQWLEIILS